MYNYDINLHKLSVKDISINLGIVIYMTRRFCTKISLNLYK